MPEEFMLGELGYVVACARSVYAALVTTAQELGQKDDSARARSNTELHVSSSAQADVGKRRVEPATRARSSTAAPGPRRRTETEAERLMRAMKYSGFM